MNTNRLAIVMLATVVFFSVLGFHSSPGPQKSYGFLYGVLIGTIGAFLIGYSRLIELKRICAVFACALLAIALLSFACFLGKYGEYSEVVLLFLVIAIVTFAVAVPFALFSIAGWISYCFAQKTLRTSDDARP